MREIKFRAWCKSTNGYLIQEKESTQIKSLHGLISQLEFNERKYGDDIVLEQYTGIKDKNEKEIYEGDIINVAMNEHWEGDRARIEKFKICYGEGYYDSGIYTYIGFYLVSGEGDADGNGGIISADESEWIEIIGNIHENPELI